MDALAGIGAAIDAALDADLGGLTDAELMERVVAAERAINRLQAMKLAALEKVDRHGAVLAEHQTTATWLRSVTGCTPAGASRQVHLARDLADVMPAMASALAAGDVTVEHAQIAAGLRKTSRDSVVRDTDEQVAEAARRLPLHEFRGFVISVRHGLEPDRVAADERRAYDQRELVSDTTIYGLGVGRWLLDPVSQETVMTAIHAAADPLKAADPFATAKQRRADALLTIARFFIDHHAEPTTTKKALPHLLVRVDLDTLAGEPGSPAAQTGYGATLSRAAVQRLSCDAAISRILFGPGSEIIDAGRTTRTFSAGARRAVIARDHHCRWPDCTAPPAWCEVHHSVHWTDGGPSDPDNGILLCGRHHDYVHHHDCAVIIQADGTRTVEPLKGSARLFGRVKDRRSPATRGSPEARAG